MVTEVERMNASIVSNIYFGNGDFVLGNINKHTISHEETGKRYGNFYWIRDIAYLSGGYAGAGLSREINPYNIWIVRTSFPDITKFSATNGSKSNPVFFDLEGYEYVSKTKVTQIMTRIVPRLIHTKKVLGKETGYIGS